MAQTEQNSELTYLTEKEIQFFLSEGGLLCAEMARTGFRGRVHLARAFPFETEEEYISVLDEEKTELGMLRRLADFSEETVTLLREEMTKKYFSPKIKKILKMTERFGAAYWDCETDMGVLQFTVKDPLRSILRVGEDRAFVVDVDGCRYEIESLSGMDKKSHSKIELYL